MFHLDFLLLQPILGQKLASCYMTTLSILKSIMKNKQLIAREWPSGKWFPMAKLRGAEQNASEEWPGWSAG